MMNRVLIIAEAGVNHNGDLNKAMQLIDAAATAGVDYVKFQTFKAEHLVSKVAKKAQYQTASMPNDCNEDQFSMLKRLELSEQDHYILIDYCKQKKVNFLSTAFDPESLAFLDKLNLDFVKVPSGEITNLPYLRKIATLGKKILVSTGMATMDEIGQTLEVLKNAGVSSDDLIVLHCNTEYPTPFEDANLRAMQHIKDVYSCEVGYSDHTPGIEASVAAVALGAILIEKHFTLDRNLPGPDHKASLEPFELNALVSAIRNIEKGLGNGVKSPSSSEIRNMVIVRKSIHLSRNMKKGEVIKEEDLEMKRPGDGISPMLMEGVIGKVILSDLPREHKLMFTDLSA